ncbi:hypothetical protein NFI96_006759, partial [Prochilodus magdalenae]
FTSPQSESDEWRKRVNSFLLDLCLQAALHQKENLHTTVETLMSCTYGDRGDFLLDLCLQAALHQKENLHTTVETLMSCACCDKRDFLLDLYSHVKDYENQSGRSVLPALQPVYQSAPAVWIINLSERKSSLFLEVLNLQTVKKPVELRGWSDEESEVRSFLQCLPYISQLRFTSPQSESDEWRKRVNSFLLDLCLQAALHQKENLYTTVETLMSCTYGDRGDFLLDLCLQAALHQKENLHTTVETLMSCACCDKRDFLLDLYSHVKDYENQSGRSVLPALQPVYQSAPAVWIINLSERKSSLFLEVLKLQTVKKPVELRGWSDEESEVRSFLQCLPYISQLRFTSPQSESDEWRKRVNSFLLDLCLQAALHQKENLHTTVETLMSCTYGDRGDFLLDLCLQAALHQKENLHTTVETLMSCACCDKRDFLLDLYSHVKNYETQSGRSVLSALQPVYQSAPAVWSIDLSERKSSLFLEVLKLQTVKKPVELRGWSDEESEVRSFLQCLPYISQLR